ncbi:MAG: tryptophan-rich sensory protein [Bacteroidetes bacterium]|nr:tryptophan-rich sensory protein [Bacteroidota bacterium]
MSTLALPHRSGWQRPAAAVVITLAVGLLSGLSVQGSVENWYAQLQRPWFAPPNAVFGPVWTLLYILMGIAAGLVWNQGTARPEVRRALLLYGIQLLLNAAWSVIFFGAHALGWALLEMAVLWVLIVGCIFAFARVRRASAWLLVPYLCWVSFAFILNAAFVYLN